MADEAATISVKAVAAGDEDVDDILAELDEFDKASACAAPACAAPRATSWRALGVLRRAFPQRSPALRQRVLLRGVAPDAWGGCQWPVALAVRGAGARLCLVSDGELVGGGWPGCGGRHDIVEIAIHSVRCRVENCKF